MLLFFFFLFFLAQAILAQAFVAHASLCFSLGRWCVMPLSADQKIVPKSPGTKVKFEQENPKTPGSKAYQRYDKYKSNNTIGEVTQQGANWQDLTVDFEKGWLTTPDSPGIMDVDAPSGAKRAHTEGTPDREATIRAKTLAREAEHHQQVETQKIEMSSATITALRMMLREEVTAIEERLANKVESSIQELKEELRQEKETRKDLEERIAKLENENKAHKPAAPLDDMDIVEKDRIVIGGFSDMDGEEAEKLVHEVLLGVPGYQGAYATNPAPSVVMAQFDSPAMALRAVRNQRFNPKMQEHKLWASENRSPNERRRCKLVSKLKRMLIEHDKHDAKNVVVNYKWFHVRLRHGMGYHNVATVTTDGKMEWMDQDGLVSATVREAMAELEANME